MLRSFRVENHKSIKDEAELLLMPVYDKSRPVVPVTAIFGANAAGKSNVLDALRWMRHAVVDSFRLWEPERGVPRAPFKLDPAARRAPSLFAVELLLDDVRYMYGFTVDDDRVTEEWLYSYPHNRRRTVFVRSQEGWEFGSTVPRAKLEQVVDLTPRNALYLTTAARTEVADVAPVFRWFQQSLALIDPSTRWRQLLERYLSGPRHATLVALIQAADLGIRDVRIDLSEVDRIDAALDAAHDEMAELDWKIEHLAKDIDDPDEAIGALRGPSGQKYELGREIRRLLARREEAGELSFVHGKAGVVLSEQEQSFGTQAWLRVLVHALEAINNGSVLCVDEIDSSLHPRLTARLIELFRDQETNPKHAQLIFTTHDATLLGTSFGNEILMRDEVWFVEKDADSGATRLYPLSDFKPRKEENTERRYLGGSYGAVPAVYSETLVDRYKAARKERDAAA
jgi:hypothetical protein